MNGAELLTKTLIAHNVKITWGITGGVLIPLFDAMLNESDNIKNILTRHEQGAVHAAEGYSRALGKPGVCIGTSGPGATNLVTGIMDAYMDSVPIIALGGQVATHLIGNDAFQETDMYGITMPITKHSFALRDSDKIGITLTKAFKIATEGRPGPVYIDMPIDVLKKEVGSHHAHYAHHIKQAYIEGFQPTLIPNHRQVVRAAELILKAERPVLIAGGGVIIANASNELAELATLLFIPVVTTLQGKGCFDERHPLALGVIGMHGKKVANYAQINADVIIAIGTRFSDRITGNLASYAEHAKVIHVDIDPAEIGKNVKVEVPIVGDAKNTLIALIQVIKKLMRKNEKNAWSEKLMQFKEICDKCILIGKIGGKEANVPNVRIHPRQIIDVLNFVLKEDDIVTTGVGQHQMFAMHFLKRSRPRTFISSGGSGTMGFGLPSAMGAKIAMPNKNVINIDGDGSFQMNIQELGTIKENNINITSMIFNNSYLGMVRQWLEIFYGKRYAQVNLGKNIQFAKIAEAYGLNGEVVERSSELNEKIKNAIKSDVATVLDVRIEEESNILPMLPPGGNLKQMFGPCIKGPDQWF
ncbi:MAG: biosynthetic-type acetolactate synthase large subunit [Candidatus Micrarchaeota archaeon]